MSQMLHSGTACLAMLAIASTVAYAAEHDVSAGSGGGTGTRIEKSEGKKDAPQLSVAPLDHVVFPPDRPSWLADDPELDGDLHKWVVVTSPCETKSECQAELDLMSRAAVASYIKLLTKSEKFDFYEVNNEWIQERLVTREYGGMVKQGDSEMREEAVELTFSTEVRGEIMTAFRELQVSDRLKQLGALAFIGMTLLICASMFLCMLSRRAERKEAAVVTV